MADYPRGWYPSPHVGGRDQWWNGVAWTPRTRLSAGEADPRLPVPPADTRRLGPGTLSTGFFSAIFGVVSLFLDPFLIPSLLAVLLGVSAVVSIRGIPEWKSRAGVLIAGVVGVVLGITGAVNSLISFFG